MNKETTLDSLLSRIAIDPISGCWQWTGSVDKDGYGVVSIGNRSKKVHRVFYDLYYGAIDEDLVVCHQCDNPPCCNPEHLFQGTVQDNSDDMVEKGRSLKGERNTKTGLRKDEVEDIRRQYQEGMLQREIADFYGMTQQAISSIVAGINWKD